jgi:hypothetical protein
MCGVPSLDSDVEIWRVKYIKKLRIKAAEMKFMRHTRFHEHCI